MPSQPSPLGAYYNDVTVPLPHIPPPPVKAPTRAPSVGPLKNYQSGGAGLIKPEMTIKGEGIDEFIIPL